MVIFTSAYRFAVAGLLDLNIENMPQYIILFLL
jgi:hypothetical protein